MTATPECNEAGPEGECLRRATPNICNEIDEKSKTADDVTRLTLLADTGRLVFVPLEFCLGTSRTQAEKLVLVGKWWDQQCWRPELLPALGYGWPISRGP